jgi:hypothetical protein
VSKQNHIEEMLAKDGFEKVRIRFLQPELAGDLQKYTTDQLLDLAYTVASVTQGLVGGLEEIENRQHSERLAEHIKWGRWEFISDHIQDGGEITDELRAFLVEVLNGKKRDNRRPTSSKIHEQHNRITLFVVEAVRGGQIAAEAYRDASDRFGPTPETIEEICKRKAEGVINLVHYMAWVKDLQEKTREALERIGAELLRRGLPPAKPRYEVSKGALTEHFLTPCLLGTS